jgi:hypothetical protein
MSVIRFLSRGICWTTSCALVAGLVAAAGAQTVLIDFGNDTSYRGLTVINPDTNGNYWNSLQPGLFVENLIDLDNVATTIDLGWDTPVGTDSYNGPAGPTGPDDDKEDLRNNDLPFTDVDTVALGNLGGALDALFDFAAGPSLADNRARFQIQGLDPTRTYDLRFFGSHSFSFDTETVYSVYTDNTYATQVATTSLAMQDPVEFWLHNRDQVATLGGLAPQTDNILYVEFVGSTGMEGYLNAMEIVASESTVLQGDYNGDSVVDAVDYTVWRNNLGDTTEVNINNAGNGTDGVDPGDYTVWRQSYGNGTPGGGGLAAGQLVPEPATWLICLLASAGAVCIRSRH